MATKEPAITPQTKKLQLSHLTATSTPNNLLNLFTPQQVLELADEQEDTSYIYQETMDTGHTHDSVTMLIQHLATRDEAARKEVWDREDRLRREAQEREDKAKKEAWERERAAQNEA